jgi:deoxyhypusine synthase
MFGLFDDDDYMNTTPKSNCVSVLKTANQNIVEHELEKMLARLALAEKMLEEKGLEEEYEKRLRSFPVTESDYDERVNSLFLELVGNIVTQCE